MIFSPNYFFKNLASCAGLTLLLSSPFGYGMTIDTLFGMADEKYEARFVLTNDTDSPYFIKTSIEELSVTPEGGLIREPYTKDNLSQWTASITPSRAIIQPKFKRTFKMKYHCNGIGSIEETCLPIKERAYQLSFVPSIYSQGEAGATVQIAIGFSALFVVPGKESPIDKVHVAYDGKQLVVTNPSTGFVRLDVDTCSNYETSKQIGCRQKALVLSGRTLSIQLSDKLQEQNALMSIQSHHGAYSKKLLLEP